VVTIPVLLLVVALGLAIALTVVAILRRSVEWGLLGALLALWLLAQLLGAGLHVAA